jgi:hypothetical protein
LAVVFAGDNMNAYGYNVLGCCSVYGKLSVDTTKGKLSVEYDNDCRGPTGNETAIEMPIALFEDHLCDWTEFYHTIHYCVNGIEVSQEEAISFYLSN